MSLLEAWKKNHPQWGVKFFHSIFFKLLLIILIAGIFINFIIEMVVRDVFDSRRSFLIRSLGHYTEYLVEDIGTPPNREKAQALADAFLFDVRYESPEVQWTTSDEVPRLGELHVTPWLKYPNMFSGRSKNRGAVVFNRGEEHFIFVIAHKKHQVVSIVQERLWPLLAMVSFILLLIYLGIRWVLRPIRWLSEGVRQLSLGNLDYRIQAKRKDELGQLAEAFNGMAQRVNTLVHSKEQLLLDVSHEFRSPLTRVKVALEFFPDSVTSQSIREDINEIENMVSELLETARLGSEHGHLNCQETDLIALLHEVIQANPEQQASIQFEAMPEAVSLSLDPGRVRIVIGNLLNNAIKYSTGNNQKVTLHIREQKDCVVLEVSNPGEAIPEEEQGFLFEPFYRIDKSRSKKTGGYGLGLHLCQKIMEAHQGKIEVRSNADLTTFSVIFPKSEEAVSAKAKKDSVRERR